MMEEVQKNIYMLRLPLPNTRVKSINMITLYIVKGEPGQRSLLVDTGQKGCLEPILDAFKELGISPEETDIFLTHKHSDHDGLIKELQNPHNKIIAEEKDAINVSNINSDEYWQYLYGEYCREGLPMDYEEFRNSHPDGANHPQDGTVFTYIHEGDILEYGGYKFRCVLMPGHSPGQTCLYDDETKTLISADMLLDDVVPILFIEPDFDDPLSEYLKSLDRLEKMEIKTILPGHSNINFDVHKRIADMRENYDEKISWIKEMLKEHGSLNTWELADLRIQKEFHRVINSVSAVSRWFFFVPMCSCIRYMCGKNMIKRVLKDNGIYYYEL
jgi:glyoxylase-like metal-dependent hydrolase (beta-lactamase superfamily II)